MRWVCLLIVIAACGSSSSSTGPQSPAPTGGGSVATTEPAVASQPAEAAVAGDAERGRGLYLKYCQACHTIDGSTKFGPSWRGIWMTTIELADGRTAVVDAAFVKKSIVEPNADQTKGFPIIMPSFQGVFTDDQLDDLVAFIASIK